MFEGLGTSLFLCLVLSFTVKFNSSRSFARRFFRSALLLSCWLMTGFLCICILVSLLVTIWVRDSPSYGVLSVLCVCSFVLGGLLMRQ